MLIFWDVFIFRLLDVVIEDDGDIDMVLRSGLSCLPVGMFLAQTAIEQFIPDLEGLQSFIPGSRSFPTLDDFG